MTKSAVPDLKNYHLEPGQRIHLMGICGTAMASLAGILKDRGFQVTGSDQNPYPPMSTQLQQLGIEIMSGYKAENLSPPPDFVIVGNVISSTNPEAQELMRLQIPYTSLPKAIGEWVIGSKDSLVVSGTHGKTTTTSLLSWVAESLGKEPGFLVGGIPKNFELSFRNPKANLFVIEGDEYDTAYFDKVPKFIHYKPKHVILTSIEFDHADIYKDLSGVKGAFRRLMTLIPADGTLIYNAQDPHIAELWTECSATRRMSYGLSRADYQAKVIGLESGGTRFQVFHGTLYLGEFFIPLVGDYNVLNATSVLALSDQLGWSLEGVREAFANFKGVRRRQEIIGEPRGVTIIEDFAHHPTAVRETIQAIQNRYPGRKVYSVFEPRSATSRKKIFQNDYVEAFKGAQEVLLAEAFNPRPAKGGDPSVGFSSDRFSSEEVVQALTKAHVPSQVFASVDGIVSYLESKVQSKDVILIMSNGGFDGIYQKLLTRLS